MQITAATIHTEKDTAFMKISRVFNQLKCWWRRTLAGLLVVLYPSCCESHKGLKPQNGSTG